MALLAAVASTAFAADEEPPLSVRRIAEEFSDPLTTLPQSIGHLQSLRQIDLRGNPLTTLPKSLLALPRLEKVDVRWVQIEDNVLDRLEARGCLVYR